MFVSIELAARIDRAEMRLTETLVRSVIARGGGDAFLEPIAGGVAAFTAPQSPMNKMIGVGFDGVPDARDLDAIEAKFSARKVPLQAEVSTLAEPAFAGNLSWRGYTLEGFENVLGRAIAEADAPKLPDGVTITVMKESEAPLWLDASVDGFLSADAQGVQGPPLPDREHLKRVIGDFMTVPGFRRSIAWVDGEIAAVATLRIDDGIAQLCGASTLKRFRRRGLQTALLKTRLHEAQREGCTLAVMTTQPGSKSEENGHRQGFGLLYPRAVLVKG